MTDDHVGYPTAHSAWNGWSSSLPTREGLVGGVRISAQFLRDYELPQSLPGCREQQEPSV